MAETQEKVVKGSIEVSVLFWAPPSVRTFLSRQLFKPGAEYFVAELSKIKAPANDDERLQSRMLALATVICSVAHLEAHINSVYIQASAGDDIGISDSARKRLSELWTRSDEGKHAFRGGTGVPDALKRYRKAAYAIVGKSQADLGGYFGSARDLIFLRNALMHYRARWPSDVPQDEVALLSRLRSAFPANPFYPEPQNNFWPKGVLGAGCAQWTMSTSRGLTEWFDDLLQ
jgi:hypothetical protein